jgi:hypothetical protein
MTSPAYVYHLLLEMIMGLHWGETTLHFSPAPVPDQLQPHMLMAAEAL